jgi:hypothetical protein
VGCSTGTIDGNWNAASQKALDLFNRHAGMKLDVKVASPDALDAVKAKAGRICPLNCEHGFRADGERCVKIACGAGSFVNDDNECERKRAVPTKPQPKPAIVRRSQEPISPPKAPITAQDRSGGCYTPWAVASGKC